MLSRLSKEVHASSGPHDPARALGQLPRSADILLKHIQNGIKPDEVPDSIIISHIGNPPSILYVKRRAVLRLALAPVVEAGSRDIGVTKPFLHFCDISFVRERIHRRRPQGCA